MRFFCLLAFIFSFCSGYAQDSPAFVRNNAWGIHALRYYPFTEKADSIIAQITAKKELHSEDSAVSGYKRTSINYIVNKEYLENKIKYSFSPNNLIYKFLIKPYYSWMDYACPLPEKPDELALTLSLFEDCNTGDQNRNLSKSSLFEFIGEENISYFLDEWLGEVDIQKDQSEVLFLPVKGPLSGRSPDIYDYYLSSQKEIEGIPAYEIVFFSKDLKENTFEGYLYVSEKDFSFIKAVFTLNFSTDIGAVKDILFIQTLSQKKTVLYLGDEVRGGLLLDRQCRYAEKDSDTIPSEPLTSSQAKIPALMEKAKNTPSYRNIENGMYLLLTNRLGIFGDAFYLGPVTQMVSNNKIEGLRLRAGGNTSARLNKHWSLGGYLAYGVGDKQFKYKAEISYARHRAMCMNFIYINDLNILGYDLLNSQRDDIFYSFSHSGIDYMSHQKIAQWSYENQFFRQFSLAFHARYWSDEPVGKGRYRTYTLKMPTIVKNIVNTELGLSFYYAPKEKYIRLGEKKLIFRHADRSLKLSHRIGIKGILGSDHQYRISEFNVFRKFNLPFQSGTLAFQFSGGKIWDQVPFPLLFIPAGNQSYIFDEEGYNLMNFTEFATDNYIAGKADLFFNWSPFKIVFPKNKIRTSFGAKFIYGPLSEKNNPARYPGLFAFYPEMRHLGNKPYVEMNVGLSKIFSFFRVEWVHRLSYKEKIFEKKKNKGSVFVTTDISF